MLTILGHKFIEVKRSSAKAAQRNPRSSDICHPSMDPPDYRFRNSQCGIPALVRRVLAAQNQHARLTFKELSNDITTEAPQFRNFRDSVMALSEARRSGCCRQGRGNRGVAIAHPRCPLIQTCFESRHHALYAASWRTVDSW
jgi:hypothetical protein